MEKTYIRINKIEASAEIADQIMNKRHGSDWLRIEKNGDQYIKNDEYQDEFNEIYDLALTKIEEAKTDMGKPTILVAEFSIGLEVMETFIYNSGNDQPIDNAEYDQRYLPLKPDEVIKVIENCLSGKYESEFINPEMSYHIDKDEFRTPRDLYVSIKMIQEPSNG